MRCRLLPPASVTEWASEVGPQASPMPSNNSVGGVSPETHNAIAGNPEQGVKIDVDADDNQVVGNLIGVMEQDSTFTSRLGNGRRRGVLVESQSNLIGGVVAGATNIVSANAMDGIHIEGTGSFDNRIEGNYIGTDINGTFLLGQGDPGQRRGRHLHRRCPGQSDRHSRRLGRRREPRGKCRLG